MFAQFLVAFKCHLSNQAYYFSTLSSVQSPGTLAKLFRTIQTAANAMRSGDNCLVGGFICLEWVKPMQGAVPKAFALTAKQPFLDQVLAAVNAGHFLKENLPGKFLQLIEDAFQFTLIVHRLLDPTRRYK